MEDTPQIQLPMQAKGLMREILSEPGPGGTGSSSRLVTVVIVGAVIAWVSYGVVRTGKLEMGQVQAALTFLTSAGFFYGVNRVTGGQKPKE